MQKELTHIGVLGMKWGHRKNPDAPTGVNTNRKQSEVVLGPGEKLHHVTGDPSLKLSPDILYTSFTKKDVLRYRGEYADQVRSMRNIEKVLDYTLVAKNELISPTKERRVKEFVDMYKDRPAHLSEIAKSNLECSRVLQVAKFLGIRSVDKDTARYRDLINSKDPKDQERAFRDFVKVLPLSKPMRDRYVNRLEKQGFNSMYDDNDILKGYSDKPLIVFNPKRDLKIKSSVTDDQNATDRVFEELESMLNE